MIATLINQTLLSTGGRSVPGYVFLGVGLGGGLSKPSVKPHHMLSWDPMIRTPDTIPDKARIDGEVPNPSRLL